MSLIHPNMAFPVKPILGTTYWVPEHSLFMLSFVLALLGLTTLYAQLVSYAGGLGLAAYITLVVGLILMTAVTFSEAYLFPTFAATVPTFFDPNGPLLSSPLFIASLAVTVLTYMVGHVLFGIVAWRAKQILGWMAILMGLGAVLSILGGFLVPEGGGRLVRCL